MIRRDDLGITPSCPSCLGAMVLRSNRRDGTSFWGCRRYPACRGTRDVGSDSTESQVEESTESLAQVRVLWNDATLVLATSESGTL